MGNRWLAKLLQQQQRRWLLSRFLQHLLLPSPFLSLLAELRPFSTAAQTEDTRPQKLPPPPLSGTDHFIVDYLVDSCGLSRPEAAKASKRVAHLKSPEKPDAVLRLLKDTGLCAAHIRRLVLSDSRILVADAKNTLEPKIRALRDAGFSKPELAELISINPDTIRRRDAVPKIEFWRRLLGSNQKLLKVAKNSYLLGCTVGGEMADPNLSFLRSVGMSDGDIGRWVLRWPRLVSSKLGRIMSIVERVKRLGVAPGSGMFFKALSTVSKLSESTLEAKSRLLRSYGLSEAEVLHVFQSSPAVFGLSEKKISRAMDFLLNEAGYRPSYIARRGVLLIYSIDKRLIPRCYVLRFLKKKGLSGGEVDLFTAVLMPDKKFLDRFIAPIREYVPEMLETYPEVGTMLIGMVQ